MSRVCNKVLILEIMLPEFFITQCREESLYAISYLDPSSQFDRTPISTSLSFRSRVWTLSPSGSGISIETESDGLKNAVQYAVGPP